MNNILHFIITGGTIDSYYDPISGNTLPNVHSTIPLFIPILKLYENCKYTEVFMKDSRDIKLTDRKKLLKATKQSKAQKIIITHGSYTIAETAKYLKQNLEKNSKVIVLVCSMIPLTGIAPTDAGFNLGYAVAKTQDLNSGIYVCINGRVFMPEEVTKILAEGRFDSIYKK